MSAKHTPGPWTAEHIRHMGWTVRTVDENGPADFIAHRISSPGVEAEDNARLIAAAPELLEALEEHLRWYDGGPAGRAVDEDALIARTRAAIEKAKGAP